MFVEGLSENHYVIHVDYDFSFVYKIAEYMVHHCLEGCGRVTEFEKHY